MKYVYFGSTKKNIGLVNAHCRACRGTGRLGFFGGNPIPCSCVRLVAKPTILERVIARVKQGLRLFNPFKWRKSNVRQTA